MLTNMADFVAWVSGAERGLGRHLGAFLEAYLANRAEAVNVVLEAEAIVASLFRLIEKANWRGTATELLTALEPDEKARRPKDGRRQTSSRAGWSG